jgi:hypothetical protein
MDARVVLPLALFLVLAALFLLFLRRASLLLTATREHDRFTKAIVELDRRMAATLDPLVTKLDLLRRHEVGPDVLAEPLSSALDDLRRQTEAVRALRAPTGLGDVPSAFARELERAERAVGLAEHGRSGLVATRGGPRELEAQTSLKRATLNLRNARQAAATIAHRVEASVPAEVARARARDRRPRDARAAAPAGGQGPAATRRASSTRTGGGSDPSM